MKKRQPSKTPYTRTWPQSKPPRPSERPGWSEGKKDYIRKPNWLQRFVKAFFSRNEKPEIIPTDRPPRPNPRITPTTTRGNYPSTQKQLEKEYDKYLSEENRE